MKRPPVNISYPANIRPAPFGNRKTNKKIARKKSRTWRRQIRSEPVKNPQSLGESRRFQIRIERLCARRRTANDTKIKKLIDKPPAVRTFNGFKSNPSTGVVVQLVRTPACHAGGREFESRPSRHLNKRNRFGLRFFILHAKSKKRAGKPLNRLRTPAGKGPAPNSSAIGTTRNAGERAAARSSGTKWPLRKKNGAIAASTCRKNPKILRRNAISKNYRNMPEPPLERLRKNFIDYQPENRAHFFGFPLVKTPPTHRTHQSSL